MQGFLVRCSASVGWISNKVSFFFINTKSSLILDHRRNVVCSSWRDCLGNESSASFFSQLLDLGRKLGVTILVSNF